MWRLLLFPVLFVGAFASPLNFSCPCANTTLCGPLTTPPGPELFIFQVSQANWQNYDWSLITTVVLFDGLDPQMLCQAHSSGARVVWGADYPIAQLSNATNRQIWVQQQVAQVVATGTDGVNVDMEDPIADDPPDKALFTLLIQELTAAMHAAVPYSQVTIDVAWSPDCIDGRCYDYAGLAEACDFLFTMDYDMQSQIFPPRPCVAYANSPLNWIGNATKAFLSLGIPASKLVLGVPWYGYIYPCVNATNITVCPIQHVPFRGVNCSDAAGSEIDYKSIMDMLANNQTTGVQWDDEAESPYFSFFDSSNVMHMIRYDDPNSLGMKFLLAKQFGLRGVGMWEADSLDYSSSPRAKAQTAAMWNAFQLFFS